MTKLHNTYYILRHGEAISNVKNMNSSWPEKFHNPLTKRGVEQIKEAIKKLKKAEVDLIFSSDLLRTKQTAEMLGKGLKVKPKYDARLREIDFGTINGKPIKELLYMSFSKKELEKKRRKVETYQHILRRIKSFFSEVDKRYKNKTIVIVSHQCPLWVLETTVNGFSLIDGHKIPKEKRIGRGELRKLN